jgi:vacuolar-type H+-ATPase subunit I/STV1
MVVIRSGPGVVIQIHICKEQHDFSEVIIHQIIHTVEFCLGCISYTASYPWLWALSLAHAQSSEVLWTMMIAKAVGLSGGFGTIALVITFAFWFGLTVFILCHQGGVCYKRAIRRVYSRLDMLSTSPHDSCRIPSSSMKYPPGRITSRQT